MRRIFLMVVALIFLAVVVIPVAIVLTFNSLDKGTWVKVTAGGPEIRVAMAGDGRVEVMPLEEYLVGVVAAEMPALFEEEALKAQAVAARTYALKKRGLALQQGNAHHPQADVCTDAAHCQAWISSEEMREKWGLIRYFTYYKKIQAAVMKTAGVVITYQGKLIDPVYHSTSNGKTENAGDIWKFDIPYLKSVKSSWDLESPKYSAEVSYTLRELDLRLGTGLQALPVSNWQGSNFPFKIVETTGGGRIKKLQVESKTFTGEEFRRLLNLNSSSVQWKINGDVITFQTKGYGHGVGMSQYGANGMALEGKKFPEILTHYYTGVQLYKMTQ